LVDPVTTPRAAARGDVAEAAVRTTSVPKFMNTVLADLQSDAWQRSVKLVADVSTDILVDWDEAVMQECLFELIGTLVRAVGPGSTVSLVTGLDAPADAAAMLKIQVSAPGVATHALDDAIERARETLRHGGHLVELNTTPTSWLLAIGVTGARLGGGVDRQRVAVVVDDDVDTQAFLTAVLESHGFRVISVNDGFDALVVIERYKPDVVLTDILMPNMNGLDLITRIKKHRANLPIIVFSGYRDALVSNISGLPDRILEKPMRRDQILSAVDSVVPRTR
jgi:CheY-like chemotaxis protein